MSGGSFNYLYRKEISDLLTEIHEVKRMKKFLKKNGCDSSAKETSEVLKKLKAIAELELFHIRKVWHTAEWYMSNDWSKKDLLEAEETFKKGIRTL